MSVGKTDGRCISTEEREHYEKKREKARNSNSSWKMEGWAGQKSEYLQIQHNFRPNTLK